MFLLPWLFIIVLYIIGCLRWIHWFSVHHATTARREIFGVNTLRGKLHQLGSPNLQDIFIWGLASLGLKLASF